MNYAFIIFTETWLINIFLNCELSLLNYELYRNDRCYLTSNCSRGDGVFIGVGKDIPSSILTVPEFNFEQIYVRFSLNKCSYIFGGVYIPSFSPTHIYDSHMQSVEYIIYTFPNHTLIFEVITISLK